MLKLRKILLCNYLYYSVFLIVILISLIRLSLPKTTTYTEKSKNFQGIITKLSKKGDKLTINIKNKETIIAHTYKKEIQDLSLKLGDTVSITGTFKKPSINTTAYLFNYQNYLKRKNIHYLVEIDSLKIKKFNHSFYYSLKQRLYDYLKTNPYLMTFIIGDKSTLSQIVKRSYQENGISHLFAISGMHISLLASIINNLLNRLKYSEKLIFNVTTMILLFYLFTVGFSPSILRGVLFYILFSINKIYYFFIKPQNLFLLILSLSLLINPDYIYDIGFQYSYLISFSLISSSASISSSNSLLNLLKASIISFIASLPITLYNFYQINLMSILYNLFFVPLITTIIFPLSLLTSLLRVLTPLLAITTSLMEEISLILAKINFGKLIFKRAPTIIYVIYFLIIIMYLISKKRKLLMILLFLILIHYVLPIFDNTNYLKMLDIGQGDSILIHSHDKNILVDTGGASSHTNDNDGVLFYNIIYPTLKSLGIKKLDYLILTHGDKDHLGEAKTLIETIPVKRIVLNNNELNFYEKQLLSKKTIIAKKDLSFKVNDLKFIQLNDNLKDENDSSQIYLLIYNKIKILLTGDATIKSENFLLDNYDLGTIDILKVGHHGSKTSTSERLLKTLKPQIALISSGKDNKFNHPHSEVIERLNANNIKIYNTQKLGTITVYFNNKHLKITTQIKKCKKLSKNLDNLPKFR